MCVLIVHSVGQPCFPHRAALHAKQQAPNPTPSSLSNTRLSALWLEKQAKAMNLWKQLLVFMGDLPDEKKTLSSLDRIRALCNEVCSSRMCSMQHAYVALVYCTRIALAQPL